MVEDVGGSELEERYMKSVDLKLNASIFDIERIVLAEVKNEY